MSDSNQKTEHMSTLPPPKQDLALRCAVCGIKSTAHCSYCKIIYYCGVGHQKQHWLSIHQKECCLPTEALDGQWVPLSQAGLFQSYFYLKKTDISPHAYTFQYVVKMANQETTLPDTLLKYDRSKKQYHGYLTMGSEQKHIYFTYSDQQKQLTMYTKRTVQCSHHLDGDYEIRLYQKSK
jgi:hypothetical protein